MSLPIEINSKLIPNGKGTDCIIILNSLSESKTVEGHSQLLSMVSEFFAEKLETEIRINLDVPSIILGLQLLTDLYQRKITWPDSIEEQYDYFLLLEFVRISVPRIVLLERLKVNRLTLNNYGYLVKKYTSTSEYNRLMSNYLFHAKNEQIKDLPLELLAPLLLGKEKLYDFVLQAVQPLSNLKIAKIWLWCYSNKPNHKLACRFISHTINEKRYLLIINCFSVNFEDWVIRKLDKKYCSTQKVVSLLTSSSIDIMEKSKIIDNMSPSLLVTCFLPQNANNYLKELIVDSLSSGKLGLLIESSMNSGNLVWLDPYLNKERENYRSSNFFQKFLKWISNYQRES